MQWKDNGRGDVFSRGVSGKGAYGPLRTPYNPYGQEHNPYAQEGFEDAARQNPACGVSPWQPFAPSQPGSSSIPSQAYREPYSPVRAGAGREAYAAQPYPSSYPAGVGRPSAGTAKLPAGAGRSSRAGGPPLEGPRTKRKRGCLSRFASLVAIVVGGLLLGLLIFKAAGCSSDGFTDFSSGLSTQTDYVDPHDWSGLRWEGDKLFYYEGDTLKSRLGVDVSEHQGWIDWDAVAADGVDFAIIRLGNRGYTEGSLSTDTMFQTNLVNARAAGLQVGVYFYSQAISEEEAKEEARLVIDELDGADLDFPVTFDHEPVLVDTGRADFIDSETLDACAKAFSDTLRAAGYSTMLYGNGFDFLRYGRDVLEDYPLWHAEYHVDQPSNQYPIVLWQYSGEASIDGISTYVDVDLLLE